MLRTSVLVCIGCLPAAIPARLGARAVPPLSSAVVDEAALLSVQEARGIRALLEGLARPSGDGSSRSHPSPAPEAHARTLHDGTPLQIAVLIVDSLQGDSLEDFSLRVAQEWGIGSRAQDTGIVLVIARAERKARIEVGYGLEDRVTDVHAHQLIRGTLAPCFQAGAYAQGVYETVLRLATLVRGQHEVQQFMQPRSVQPAVPRRGPVRNSAGSVFFFLLLFYCLGGRLLPGGVLWPLLFFGTRRRYDPFGSGFSGAFGEWAGDGGGFSGGGGRFGGGGASGSW